MFRRSVGSLALVVLAWLAVAAGAGAHRPAPRASGSRVTACRSPTPPGSAPPSRRRRWRSGSASRIPTPPPSSALMPAQQNPASSQYDHFLTPRAVRRPVRGRPGRTSNGPCRGCAPAAHGSWTPRARGTSSRSPPRSSRSTGCSTTTIGSYQAKGVTFLANSSAPSVPAGLDVLTVMGLNTLIHPTTPLTGAHRGDRAPGSTLLGKATEPAALKSIPGEGGLRRRASPPSSAPPCSEPERSRCPA